MKTLVALVSTALSVLAIASASAQTLYWDPSGSGSTGGAGNWDLTSSFWFNGTADVPWANSDNAYFEGTAGTVTLQTGISAGGIYFTNVTGNYYITNLTGVEVLTVGNTIDTGGGEHTIAAPIAGSGNLNKNGAGRLHLPVDSSATLSGNVMINQGSLSVENNNSLGLASATVAPGAALEFNSGTNNLSGVYNNVTAAGTGVTNSGALRNVSGGNSLYGNVSLTGDTLFYADSGRLTFGAGYPVSATGNYNVTSAGPGSVYIGSSSFNIGTGTITVEGPSTFYMYVSASPGLATFANVVVEAGATHEVDNDNGFGTAPATLMTTNVILDGGTLANVGGYVMGSTRGITITTNGGAIMSSGGAWTTCNIYDPSNVPVTFGGSGNIRPGGSGGSSGNIVNLGTGTLIKTGGDDVNTTYATSFIFSNMVLNGGSITFSYDQSSGEPSTLGSIPSSFCPSNIWFNGGALHAGHSTTINPVRGIYVASGGGTVADTVSSGGTVTIGSVISGPGSMNFPSGLNGSHVTAIVLAANNTYTGTTTIGISNSVTVGSGSTSGTLGTGNTVDNWSLVFNRTGGYTYGGNISGTGTLVKNAGGTVTLTGACTYTNATAIGGGALLMDNTNASAVTVNSGGTLGGTGVFGGAVKVNSGGTLALGSGTLSASNDVSIAGNITVSVNNSASPSSGTAIVAGTLANTGTGKITVSNLGPALASGNSFQLFSQPVSGGSSMTISGGGVQWANNLATSGSISVVGPLPQPVINGFSLSGTNLVISGTNGYTGGGYDVLATTNIALPLSSWQTILSSTFASGGLFSVTNPMVPGTPDRFYTIKLQ